VASWCKNRIGFHSQRRLCVCTRMHSYPMETRVSPGDAYQQHHVALGAIVLHLLQKAPLREGPAPVPEAGEARLGPRHVEIHRAPLEKHLRQHPSHKERRQLVASHGWGTRLGVWARASPREGTDRRVCVLQYSRRCASVLTGKFECVRRAPSCSATAARCVAGPSSGAICGTVVWVDAPRRVNR
jgi:hypothetical protein